MLFRSNSHKISKLPLIDRINLHYKVGPFMNVPFKAKEKVFIDRIDNISSWEDVVAIAQALYKGRKEEIEELLASLDELSGAFDADGDGDDYGDDIEELRDELVDPGSSTDYEFRKNEQSLLSTDSLPYRYAFMPTADIGNIIIPHKDIYEHTDWNHMNISAATHGIDAPAEAKKLHDEYKQDRKSTRLNSSHT